jgi:hypothetical protein
VSRAPAHTPGEYLPLHWEEDAEDLYVYGHVTGDVLASAVEAERGGTVDTNDFGSFPVLTGETRQRWARFVFNGCDEYGNPCRTLREYEEPGRGRFKVTATSPTRWEHHRRCDGYAGDDPCWMRQGHTGNHAPFAARGDA